MKRTNLLTLLMWDSPETHVICVTQPEAQFHFSSTIPQPVTYMLVVVICCFLPSSLSLSSLQAL